MRELILDLQKKIYDTQDDMEPLEGILSIDEEALLDLSPREVLKVFAEIKEVIYYVNEKISAIETIAEEMELEDLKYEK